MVMRGFVVALAAWLLPCMADASILIVGSVSSTSVRILLDSVEGAPVPTAASLYVVSDAVDGATQQPVYELTKDLNLADRVDANRPHVLTVDGLSPNRRYQIVFESDGTSTPDHVKFRTPPSSSGSNQANRVLVVSCDRYVEDRDDTMWLKMHEDIVQNEDSYFGVAHIGDQIYADVGPQRVQIEAVDADVEADSKALRLHYESIVDKFRAIYRETLGRPAAQQVLRLGAHWMLPDDHEIINNFNSYFVDQAFDDLEVDKIDPAYQLGLQLHYRAGMQTLYEYQYQLREDVSWNDVDFLRDPLAAIVARYPLYFSVEVDTLKLFFLDVRFDRSFAVKAEREALVPERQFHELKSSLASWSEPSDVNSTIVVLAGMPLFFHTPFTASIAYSFEKELYPGHEEHLTGVTALYDLFHKSLNDGAFKLLVGGDVHALTYSSVCGYPSPQSIRTDRLARRCIDQLTTSGFTDGSTAIKDAKLVPFYYALTQLLPLWNALGRPLGFVTSPWWAVYTERVFLGRNYGVLEVASNGAFQWKNSVVEDHATAGQIATQFVFDWLNSKVLGAVVVIWAVRRTVRLALYQRPLGSG